MENNRFVTCGNCGAIFDEKYVVDSPNWEEKCPLCNGANIKTYVAPSPLLEFIKKEIPFRLWLLDIRGSVPQDIIDQLVEDIYAESDTMFDYDRFDNWILTKLRALGYEEEDDVDAV